jgi:hypothetical protein
MWLKPLFARTLTYVKSGFRKWLEDLQCLTRHIAETSGDREKSLVIYESSDNVDIAIHLKKSIISIFPGLVSELTNLS